jgi:hypothetical protein
LGLVSVAACSALLGIEDIPAGPANPDAALSRPDAPSDGPSPSETGTTEADADASPEADAAPPACDLSKELGKPVLLASVSTAEDEGSPRLSDDELTLYFDAQRATGTNTYDLYFAKRTALTDSFGPSKLVNGAVLATADMEYAPSVVDQGLTLIFERQAQPSFASTLWTATRLNAGDPFDAPSQVANVNSTSYNANPFARGTSNEIWFVRATGVTDIFVATKTAGVGYVVSSVANVNSPTDDDAYPVVSANGLALYFASSRPLPGAGGFNVWVSTRVLIGAPWSSPSPVANVNSASTEKPSWISPDGCRLYLASDRPGGAGGQDIYVATRPK